MRKLAVNCWSCVNAPSQYAGIAAIDGPQDEVDKMMRAFDRRRKLVVDGLNALPGISCITPKGAFYAFPNVGRTGWKAKKLASALLDEAGVALIGGPDFGMLGEGYIRLSYANSEENIARAISRIGDFLAGPAGQPRPTNGIFVAITVMNSTLASSGRQAMWTTASATLCTSMTASAATLPLACGTPTVIAAAISVSALPMSIWPQAMSNGRPSSASVLVSPVTACLVAV